MESVFQECILEATGEGRTVLLSSHILAEVEKLCDRVTIIRQGRTVQTGTLDEMRHLTRTSIAVATDRSITGLDTIDGVHDVSYDDGQVRFDVDAGALDGTIRHLSSFGIRSLVSQPPTLEELFLRHYGDELDAANGRQRSSGAMTGVAIDALSRAPAVQTSYDDLSPPRRSPALAGCCGWCFAATGSGSQCGCSVSSVSCRCRRRASLRSTRRRSDLEGYARTVRGNSALIIQAGPGYGLDDPTLGAVVMNETSLWLFIAAAVMSVFMVVRHTRTEEEAERAELVRAAPVGRHAALASAMIGTLVVNTAIAAGNVVALLAFGLPTVGSLAFGASMVGVGMVFAGVAAVTAQVASSSRAALAAGGLAVGVAFVLRAIGDVGNGCCRGRRRSVGHSRFVAYADERWWVLVLPVTATLVLVVAARALQDHRDYGSGLMAQRGGRPEATAQLSTALGLAIRLQRGSLVGWAIGLGALAFFYGLVADQAEQMIEDNPDMADFFAQLGVASVTDAFLSTAMLIMTLFATGFTVSSVLRLRSEEVSGRVDPVLATPVGRRRWAWSHLVVALVGTVVLAFVCGVAMGAGAALVLGETAGSAN